MNHVHCLSSSLIEGSLTLRTLVLEKKQKEKEKESDSSGLI